LEQVAGLIGIRSRTQRIAVVSRLHARIVHRGAVWPT
jgi:hypothetical protein